MAETGIEKNDVGLHGPVHITENYESIHIESSHESRLSELRQRMSSFMGLPPPSGLAQLQVASEVDQAAKSKKKRVDHSRDPHRKSYHVRRVHMLKTLEKRKKAQMLNQPRKDTFK